MKNQITDYFEDKGDKDNMYPLVKHEFVTVEDKTKNDVLFAL